MTLPDHIWRCCYEETIQTMIEDIISVSVGDDITFRFKSIEYSYKLMKQYREIMQVIRNSDVMKRQWVDYKKNFDYASGIEFEGTCDAVVAIMDRLYG